MQQERKKKRWPREEGEYQPKKKIGKMGRIRKWKDRKREKRKNKKGRIEKGRKGGNRSSGKRGGVFV